MEKNNLKITRENYKEYMEYLKEKKLHEKDKKKFVLSSYICLSMTVIIGSLASLISSIAIDIALIIELGAFFLILKKIEKNNKAEKNLKRKYPNVYRKYSIDEIEKVLNVTNLLDYQLKDCNEIKNEMVNSTVKEYKSLNYTNEFLTQDLPKVKVKGRTYPRR